MTSVETFVLSTGAVLARLINGLERTTSGTLIVDDFKSPASATRTAEARTNIGMIFQQFNLMNSPHRAR